MEFDLEWGQPILLGGVGNDHLLAASDMVDEVPTDPGVYVFGRKHGATNSPIYIGKAENLRARFKNHLNNARLMRALDEAGHGKRYFSYGRFYAKPGQQKSKCLLLIERGLIAWALREGYELLNVKGTRIEQHFVVSSGSYPGRRPFASEIAVVD